MKKVKKFLASIILVVMAGSVSTLPVTTKAEPAVAVSFQFFYDNLSPYGTWVSYPDYGYVWIPRASVGFRPYFSSGHWVYTYDGWMWVSYYDWGWAPFHYGSWRHDPFYGWLWVPGYHWAPAWVTWGYYSGYYGWAPLGPGISFSVSYHPPIDYWVFVPPRYVTVAGWNNTYYVASQNRIVFDNNTSIRSVRNIDVVDNTGTYNGQRFSAGPSRETFEKAAGKRLDVVSVKDANKPGKANVRGDNVSIYRPAVDASDKATAKPSKVTPLEKMKVSDTRGIDRTKSREGVKKTAPERGGAVKERAPERKVAPKERESNVKERPGERNVKESPKMEERKKDMDRNRSVEPKRNVEPKRDVESKPRMSEPRERPKSNIESSPKKSERNVAPEPRQRMERPKQSSPERIQGPQREPRPQMMPERRAPQREPQPYRPQQREKGNRSPK